MSSENLPFAKAITAGLRAAMTADDRVLLMGEDIGRLGGVFRVTEGLLAEFGEQRVLDTPLAESGIVGTAIGLAMAGFVPGLFCGWGATPIFCIYLLSMRRRREGGARDKYKK